MADTTISGSSRQRDLERQILEALGSSLCLGTVFERTYPLLGQLVPADYGALGVSASGRPADYAWVVARMPPAFFSAYPDMAAHDFVRATVAREPNRVLCDEQMIGRRELERNVLYRRAREIGAPIEHVMAVMLHVDQRWQGGLSLYRDKRRPFSARESMILQRLTPAIANAVRNCHSFGESSGRGAALERLLEARAASVLLITPSGSIADEVGGAGRLLERWFASHERRKGCLPEPIRAFAVRSAAEPHAAHTPLRWPDRAAGPALQISFVPLPANRGRATAMLVVEELSEAIPLPRAWRSMRTPREQEMASAALRGWDNRLIATELGCETETVKKHLYRVYDKVGVETRAVLIARAVELNRRHPTSR
jgi:DNA-binding CsgD family transcriptional regulator